MKNLGNYGNPQVRDSCRTGKYMGVNEVRMEEKRVTRVSPKTGNKTRSGQGGGQKS